MTTRMSRSTKDSGGEQKDEARERLTIAATEFQSHVRQLITEHYDAILTAIAEQAERGSIPHTKYLFELGGVQKEIERQGKEHEPNVAQILLAEIERRQATEVAHGEGRVPFEHRPEMADVAEERGWDWRAKAQ